jgi:hypothetical protein
MTLSDKRYIGSVLERVAGHVAEEDVRKFARHPFPSMVKVTPLEAPAGRVRAYLTRQCPTIDLSQAGIRLLWIGSQPPERVVVTFDASLEGGKEIECGVAWWKELGTNRIELGLRFIGSHPCADPFDETVVPGEET